VKYEYQGIKLGDSIEKIINLLNNENTKLNDFDTDLIYKTGSTIEDISTRIYICLYTEKLVINIDWGTGRLKRYNDGIERIIGYTFYEQDGLEFNIRKDVVDNYLECKNLKDIFYSLWKTNTIEVDIDKREIYGQLDNYKFTFDLVTRDIKSIQNLETREFVKTYNWKKYYILKKHCLFLHNKAAKLENKKNKNYGGKSYECNWKKGTNGKIC